MQKISTIILLICALTGISKAQQPATSAISGTVNTADGHPAPGVTISIKTGKRQSMSDKNGFFSIKGLSAGSYSIHVSSVGLVSIDQDVQLSEGENKEITVVLHETADVLEEVIVSAQRQKLLAKKSDYVAKMPLDRLENAQVYSTVTRELMDQQLVFNVEDAVRNVPGMTKLWDAVGRAGIGGSYFILRGFSIQPKLRNGLTGNISNGIDAVNLEKLEIIKGPSATLFGSVLTSYGGLINRVTKKPYETFGGSVSYSGGSFGMNRLTADINTPVGHNDDLLFRVNAAYQKEKSWQDFGYRNGVTVAPSLTYKVNDRMTLQFDAEYMQSEQAGMTQMIYFLPPSRINPIIGGVLMNALKDENAVNAIMAGMPQNVMEAYGTNRADEIKMDYKRSYTSNDVINKNSNANFFAEMDYQISDAWKSQTVVSQNNSQSNGDMPYFYLMPNYLPAVIQSLPTGSLSTGTPGYDQMLRLSWRPIGYDHALEIQQNFTGDFQVGRLRNRVVAGLDFYNYRTSLNYNRFEGSLLGLPYADVFDVVNTSGNVPNYSHFSKGKLDSAYAAGKSVDLLSSAQNNVYSAYVSDVLNVTEQLIVSAGLRIDHFDNKGVYNISDGTYSGDYNQTALAPKFGLIFQPIVGQLSLFGNYQSGFTNQTGTNAAGETFKPEQAFQWEGGVKTDFFESRLAATLSYYDIKVNDIVRADVLNPGFSIQDGTQKSSGIEAEIIAYPVRGLSLIAGYGYNKSVLEDADADVEGLRPITAGPKNTGNLWINYQFATTALKGFGLGFGGNYASEGLAINSHSDGQFILPSYTVLNAALSYDTDKFRIGAKLNNLANKKYWIGWTTMTPQMQRQFLASIEYKF